MTKQTAILDLLDTIRGPETPGANVERFAIPVLVLGTTEDIRAGTVLINSAVRLPQSVHFASKQYGPWKLLTTMDGFAVERTLSELGWHFFFMVQGIRAAGRFSYATRRVDKSSQKVDRAAAELQSFNVLEIVEITRQRFLWLYYARAAAYPRDAKPSSFVRELDRYHASRNVWNFKQVFRRRAQIGRTSKGI